MDGMRTAEIGDADLRKTEEAHLALFDKTADRACHVLDRHGSVEAVPFGQCHQVPPRRRAALTGRYHASSTRDLVRSLNSGIAVYDTLFIELAEREGTFLATFDEKVLKACPAIAR